MKGEMSSSLPGIVLAILLACAPVLAALVLQVDANTPLVVSRRALIYSLSAVWFVLVGVALNWIVWPALKKRKQ